MAKNVKIFIVAGVFLDLEENQKVMTELSCIVGYFTNLKELYKNFQPNTIQSYSTISSYIRKNKYYISYNSRFWNRERYEKFSELIIREVATNQLYT